MPQVLMALMRHESIETTLRYYVGRNAQTIADAAWDAFDAKNGPTFGPTRQGHGGERGATRRKPIASKGLLSEAVGARTRDLRIVTVLIRDGLPTRPTGTPCDPPPRPAKNAG